MNPSILPLGALLLFGLAFARAEPTADEIDTAKRKFEVWKQYPDQLAKLRQAAATLASLPPQRREQLENLDRELASESSAVQARLQNVLDRYTAWLAALPEEDRERIRNAPDKNARLAIVKDLRQHEWLRQQAKAVRDAIAATPADARPAALAKARAEDRQRQSEWNIARRFWDDIAKKKHLPSRLTDFEPAVQNYVNDALVRRLSKKDRERLSAAEGSWPLYPQTLVELADQNPPALPSPDGPSTIADLPKAVRDSLVIGKKGGNLLVNQKVLAGRLKAFEGRTTEFAMKLTTIANEGGWVMPLEWWAYNFNSLTPAMQDFLKQKMEPLLDRKENRLLLDAEGKWPEYPETIQKLAAAHNLQVPWFVLPGASERWDVYRAGRPPTVPGFPELPKYKLRDFVYFDLDDLDRVKFKNELDRTRTKFDQHAWTYLVTSYFQRYPSELAWLRQIDR